MGAEILPVALYRGILYHHSKFFPLLVNKNARRCVKNPAYEVIKTEDIKSAAKVLVSNTHGYICKYYYYFYYAKDNSKRLRMTHALVTEDN